MRISLVFLITIMLLYAKSYSQIAEYGKIPRPGSSKKNYSEYITKHNDTLRIGDTLVFGKAYNEGGTYIHITQLGRGCSPSFNNLFYWEIINITHEMNNVKSNYLKIY